MSCVLTEKLKSKLQAVEIKFSSITGRDRIRNDMVRMQLDVEAFIKRVEQQKVNWLDIR